MATEIVSPPSFPQEMNYTLPSSLPAGKNYEVRVQPLNAQSFTAGNVVQVDIPCGKTRRLSRSINDLYPF